MIAETGRSTEETFSFGLSVGSVEAAKVYEFGVRKIIAPTRIIPGGGVLFNQMFFVLLLHSAGCHESVLLFVPALGI